MTVDRAKSFWLWVVVGTILVGAGMATFGSAYGLSSSSSSAEPEVTPAGGLNLGQSSIFATGDEFDPSVWYLLGAGMLLAATISLAVAARRR